MKKQRIFALFLTGALIVSLTGCTEEKPVATMQDTPSAVTAAADVTSDTESGDDISAEASTPTETVSEPGSSTAEKEGSPPVRPETVNPTDEAVTSEVAKPTEAPKPEQPKESAAPSVESKPAPSKPEQPEPQTPVEPVKPKSAYDYEFDTEAIRSDLIAIGEGMGLTHITTDDGNPITPDNASWGAPITASQSYQGESLRQKLTEYVKSMPGLITAYGGEAIEYFTIYVQANGGGSYTFYFLY